MLLVTIFDKDAINTDLRSKTKEDAFEELLEAIQNVQPDLNTKEALESLTERESRMSTGIMPHVALPHALCLSVRGTVGAIGISRSGIAYDALDGSPVHLIFMLLANPESCGQSLRVLKHLADLLERPKFVTDLTEKKNAEEIQKMLNLQNFVKAPVRAAG
jgi:mannitol/fructose-specific phosphotransferase system IIA component (Ntr-type)